MSNAYSRWWLLLVLIAAGCDHSGAEYRRLLQDSQDQATSGDLEKATQLAEQALELRSDEAEAWLWQARLLEAQALELIQAGKTEAAYELYAKCADAMRRVAEISGPLASEQSELLGTALYHEACYLAKQGKPQQAFETLQQAYDAGFYELGEIESNPDLQTVRNLDAYRDFLGEKRQAWRSRVRTDLARFESYPFTFALADVEGETVSLDSLRGNVVLVDFWATWCMPCRKGIPHLISLTEDYARQDVQVVGIALERGTVEDAQRKLRIFKSLSGINYPCLVGSQDVAEQVPDFEFIPTMVLIDHTGKVRQTFVGPQSKFKLSLYVDELLEETASGEL